MTRIDKYLDGKVQLLQPSKGYRAGIDAVLLAVSVHPKKNECVLDVGAGAGAVMQCISAYYPQASITGLELQHEMVELNQRNIELNHKQDTLEVLQGSIFDPPAELEPNSFDHVVTNPPYFDFGEKALNEDKVKSLSRHVAGSDIGGWLQACGRMVKPRGYLTLIQRVELLDEMLAVLRQKFGGIKIFPLWPGEGVPAKLVLIQARKAVKTECQLLPGLILHGSDQKYTAQAEAIFRGQGILKF